MVKIEGKIGNIVGIDCGLKYFENTTGICQVENETVKVHRVFPDLLSKVEVLKLKTRSVDLVCMDAPLLPMAFPPEPEEINGMWTSRRAVETLFSMGKFSKFCKPGNTRLSAPFDGTGKLQSTGHGLRRIGAETANQLLDYLKDDRDIMPQVVPGKNMIETFPNLVLGMLPDENDYGQLPPQRAGGGRDKFDRLYDYVFGAADHRFVKKLQAASRVTEHRIWTELEKERDHEKRAALICGLIGILVANGCYTAIGEKQTGYFFLPPRECWGDWVKEALNDNLKKYFKKNSRKICYWKTENWKKNSIRMIAKFPEYQKRIFADGIPAAMFGMDDIHAEYRRLVDGRVIHDGADVDGERHGRRLRRHVRQPDPDGPEQLTGQGRRPGWRILLARG